jgi:hypothetical protein
LEGRGGVSPPRREIKMKCTSYKLVNIKTKICEREGSARDMRAFSRKNKGKYQIYLSGKSTMIGKKIN